MAFKVTTWNVEHMAEVLGGGANLRRDRIAQEILDLDADVLCVQEGTPNLLHLRDFVANDLGGQYAVVERDGTAPALVAEPDNPHKALAKLYGFSSHKTFGRQWIWFLVRATHAAAAQLRPLADWRAATLPGRPFPKPDDDGSWTVNYAGGFCPQWHKHFRHPQVLEIEVSGVTVECIGAHLKSKHNTRGALVRNPYRPEEKIISCKFLDEAVEDRVKLATEAQDIRRYLDARFDAAVQAGQEEPRIMVMGDLNDGPGKEVIERENLFFDILSSVQGDVFFARRLLNHALFDFDQDDRWTHELGRDDPLDPERSRRILLDHLLFTQSLTGSATPIRIDGGAGLVEHVIHDTINAGAGDDERSSDHVPVSVVITT